MSPTLLRGPLYLLGALLAAVVVVEIFVRSPTLAAVLVAVALALIDHWRRRRRWF